MPKNCFLAVFVLCMLVAHASRADDSQKEDGQKPVQQEKTLGDQVPSPMKYLLYLPPDYDQQEAWPLVLFLHGAGERGDDLSQVKKHGPPKLVEAARQFPFIVVSPQCPRGEWWEPQALLALLDHVEAENKVDKDRVYVTGLSMGGFGTWRLASDAPDRFAAIAPICGGGEPEWAKELAKLPIWVFHGDRDAVVPAERSERMVTALKEAGGNVKYTVYPNVGHDSWTVTYDNPDFYTWLLAQKRPANDARDE